MGSKSFRNGHGDGLGSDSTAPDDALRFVAACSSESALDGAMGLGALAPGITEWPSVPMAHYPENRMP